MVARMVAVWPLIPAMLININWADGIAAPWNLAAAGAIVGSAVFVEASWQARSWLMSPVYLLLATILFACNAQVAFENVTTRSDHRSDHRKSAMVAAKSQWSQRSQWSQGRAEAATIAGEAAPATFQSEIDAKIASDSRRWQSTGECNPLQITAADSRSFCSAIAELKAKKAAAERRDELDAKVAAIDAKAELAGEVPTSADPFADNVAAFLSMFGVELSNATKKAIGAQKDVLRSVTLEIVATFGPTAWLLTVNGMMSAAPHAPVPKPTPERKPERRSWSWRRNRHDKADLAAKVENIDMAEPAPAVALDDPFHKFVAEMIEEATGITTPASETFKAWQAWCAKYGLEIGTQKAFGTKMVAKFARENNNHRPRYLNIRIRSTRPSLRVVG